MFEMFFGLIFYGFIAFIVITLSYGIFKGIFGLIKDLFISLFIWMGDEELLKKREENRLNEMSEFDTYQG